MGFRSLVTRLVPVERGGTKRAKIFWQWKVATKGFNALREGRDGQCEGRNEKCEFLARESVSSSSIVRIFGKGKCKFIANFSAAMVTSLPSYSLPSLSLSLSLSLSHREYLTHNIGSASALAIISRYVFVSVETMSPWRYPACLRPCLDIALDNWTGWNR